MALMEQPDHKDQPELTVLMAQPDHKDLRDQ